MLGDLLHRPSLPAQMERAACTVEHHRWDADDATRNLFVSHELIDRLCILEEHEHFEVLSLAAAALANLSADVPSKTAGAIVRAGGVEVAAHLRSSRAQRYERTHWAMVCRRTVIYAARGRRPRLQWLSAMA